MSRVGRRCLVGASTLCVLALASSLVVAQRYRSLARPWRTISCGKKSVFAVAFSPSGELLAEGSDDGSVRVYATASGELVSEVAASTSAAPVKALAFTPTGDHLLVGTGEAEFRVLGSRGSVLERVLPGPVDTHRWGPYTVAISSRRELCAWVDYSDALHVIALANGQEVRTLENDGGRIRALAFSPRGDLLAVGCPGAVDLLSVGDCRHIARIRHADAECDSIAFDPAGDRLAIAVDDKIYVALVRDGSVVCELDERKGVENHSWRNSLAFSPQGDVLAAGRVDGSIFAWSMRDGKKLLERMGPLDFVTLVGDLGLIKPGVAIYAIAFSPDGWLATGHGEGVMKLWWATRL